MIKEVIARGMRHRDKSVCERGTYEEQAQAALDAIRDAGFVIVPAKPTEAMCLAGSHADDDTLPWEAEDIYKAMVSAAGDLPKTPS